ncbi:hypothetical protein K0M31_014405 [Melipona bicolor]|uniref:Uncharacterized protein n=1 Tax=Melipona bicolor TaxID=60889 RepID=A0AA40G8H1_9HYME|nr:hypothetical protein K0M31_014405 [Melipona bicolor]
MKDREPVRDEIIAKWLSTLTKSRRMKVILAFKVCARFKKFLNKNYEPTTSALVNRTSWWEEQRQPWVERHDRGAASLAIGCLGIASDVIHVRGALASKESRGRSLS